ncbi:uncharacterized protein SPSK_09967 [Sporothrix schenckii 1099-18]|uniref:Uncharacterized protein n=1 Tax=Sporothrix schenckii 1099-18 TaxID=1397361 RepID=A0A0F2M937_SPOSC|nr:uncharacterized protein SPSK_09967 [Sporothrix schenckii 1099-18]KJR85594.1 hypothetical protein SPSK_09967 [Sporothrix schenckii 1099-18]
MTMHKKPAHPQGVGCSQRAQLSRIGLDAISASASKTVPKRYRFLSLPFTWALPFTSTSRDWVKVGTDTATRHSGRLAWLTNTAEHTNRFKTHKLPPEAQSRKAWPPDLAGIAAEVATTMFKLKGADLGRFNAMHKA